MSLRKRAHRTGQVAYNLNIIPDELSFFKLRPLIVFSRNVTCVPVSTHIEQLVQYDVRAVVTAALNKTHVELTLT